MKISVIIPVCNIDSNIDRGFRGLQLQTLTDIEIICVYMADKEDGPRFIRELAELDTGIRFVRCEQSDGILQAKKKAIGISRGEYIMFLNPCDELAPDACELAYNAIEKYQSDIVGFGSLCANGLSFNGEDIAVYDKNPGLVDESITGDILTECYKEKKFTHDLYGKIYQGELCRRAAADIEDICISEGEDTYIFFLIAYYSMTYAYISSSLYYRYAVTENNEDKFLHIDEFKSRLNNFLVIRALRDFCKRKGKAEKYNEIVEIISKSYLDENVKLWREKLVPEALSEGFEILTSMWGFCNVLCGLAENAWGSCSDVACKAIETEYFSHIKRSKEKKLTIGLYYRRITGGGAERVTAQLCNLLSGIKDDYGNAKYRVILITDEKPQRDEYVLNDIVEREFVPDNRKSVKGNYKDRFTAWTEILDRKSIDIIISGQWCDPYTLWDMLTIKGHTSKPAFIMHIHNFTMRPYQSLDDKSLELFYTYQLCDGITVLSECDESFIKNFCANTHYIPNPVKYISDNGDNTSREPHSIVWTGRLAYTKQPLDLIYMMAYIVKKVPDARLYIVGTGDDRLISKLRQETERLKLEHNVVFTGFTMDVDAWLKKASVYVCTSEFEGFPMSIGEALSYSLPVIMYDMPWLTYVRERKGVRTVGMGRFDLMAEEVTDLLEHPDKAKRIGLEGKSLIDDLAAIDIGSCWDNVINGIVTEDHRAALDTDEKLRFQYLSLYQEQAKSKIRLDCINRNIPRHISGFTTARIDIRIEGSGNNDLKVLEVSDNNIVIDKPSWMTDDNSTGYMIQSEGNYSNGCIKFCVLCKGSGTLMLVLRGSDVRDELGKRVPVWIDYMSCEVNHNQLLPKMKCACHDRPVKFRIDVTDGERIMVEAAWKSHAQGNISREEELCNRIDKLNVQNVQLSDRLERIFAEKSELSAKLTKTYAEKSELNAKLKKTYAEKAERGIEIKKLNNEIESLRLSRSYRAGRAITWPIRMLRNLFIK